MAETFVLEITTPERLIAREPVTEAQIPGLDGYLGVLPGHAALLGELGFGELSYKTGGTLHRVVVHGGFVEINGDTTRVLCSSAEMPDQIDLERAKKALERARKRLTASGEFDIARALNASRRAEARVVAATQMAKK